MTMFRIHGVIKNYDWGGKDYLSSLLSLPSDGKPEAEYWMGTHPSGEAVTDDGERLSFRIGHALPFLFKVLSIASPLSLQCHPTKAQARDGWKREENARREGKEVNYRDDNEKAEILLSLTPVTALCGFREFNEIRASLSTAIPLSYSKYLSSFSGIKPLFTSLFSFPQEVKSEILTELKAYAYDDSLPQYEGDYLTQSGIIRETLVKYEDDIGSVFPLMMNIVHLKAGEAVYLAPDTLHAYILGNGVELMTASDNVLRGGLTKKRIDLGELERIMCFETTKPEKTKTRFSSGGVKWYVTPSPDFTLGSVSSDASLALEKDSLLLSLGDSSVSSTDGTLLLEKGECIYVSGSDETIKLRTSGSIFIATGGASL